MESLIQNLKELSTTYLLACFYRTVTKFLLHNVFLSKYSLIYQKH